MYEDRTYENILAETLERAPDGIDIREGSIFYDAVAGVCFKIARYYADLRNSFDLVFIATAVDEYLDQRGAEYGIVRNPATSARYLFTFEGERPSAGERFFCNGQYFTLGEEKGVVYLEADDTGAGTNGIEAGSAAVPLNNLPGLISATFGKLIEPGVSVESDEDYRQRIQEKIAGPAENGNRQHYKTWCEKDAGVGRARIISLFAGENTVMGVLVGADGAPAAEAVVKRVQEDVDPITLGHEVAYNGKMIPIGDGLGNGKANIGAHFAAVSATAHEITVSFSAVLATGATKEQAAAEASAAITDYFKSLALDTPEGEHIITRLSKVGVLLYEQNSIIDYSDLYFNGQSSNIELKDTEVPILKGVSVSANIR